MTNTVQLTTEQARVLADACVYFGRHLNSIINSEVIQDCQPAEQQRFIRKSNALKLAYRELVKVPSEQVEP